MSRYSSDSDSSNYHRQGRRKRRSPSASSSDSSRRRRSKSSKHSNSRYRKSSSSSKRYRTKSYKRSRSRSKNSSRHSRSTSKEERHKRSHSREKYKSKRHYKSRMSSNCRSAKYHSRSSSSESKNSTSSSNSTKSSSAGSKKSSLNTQKNFSSDMTLNPEEQLREKLLKAIKAAESADHQLKQQGVLPKCVKSRNDINNLTQTQLQSEALKDINADVLFVPKTFKSSRQGKEKNLDDFDDSSDVHVSDAADVENSIFHTSFFIDPKAKLDWWVKKLYQIRQRAISGEPLT